MVDHEIKCPQPIRSLKRKASQLHALENPLYKHSHIDAWLSETITSINRGKSRSDGFLLRKMDPERQGHQQNGPGPARSLSKPTDARSVQPESGQYLPAQSPSTFYDPCQSQYSFYTPPTSSTTASQFYQSNMTTPDSKESSNKSNRVRSPTYRNKLARHRVHIVSRMKTPAAVQSYANNIINRKRHSPGLSGQELDSTEKEISTLASNDEGSTVKQLSSTSLFPTQAHYDGRVALGGGVPFHRAGLPFVSGYNYPPIVAPRSDLHYGYPESSFIDNEYATMQHSRLKPYSQPTSANFWPFFAVEFKSQSRGGTSWVAENQNAGTGSHSVNSMEILMKYARGQRQRQITDTVFFSCVADTSSASIWVHWMDSNDHPRFSSSEVDLYSMKKPKDLVAFRASVRNIIDYGIDQRLTIIKDALHDLLPQVSQWDQEDKEPIS